MLDYSVKIYGIKEFLDKIKKLEKITSSYELKAYIAEKAIKEINLIAMQRLNSSNNYISNNKYNIKKNEIEIYNDSHSEDGTYYSLIIEYGSGTFAEAEHIGETEEFIESGYDWWYAFGKHIRVHGQEPKHIYTDAAKIIEKKLSLWADEYIQKEIDKL